MTTVVVAPDSFKQSLDAASVATHLAAGWRRVRPDDDVRPVPMADGGEGTLEAFAVAFPGARRVPVRVMGPHDLAVEAEWLWLPDGTAVVELASTSGIELLGDELRPLSAHTQGFGEAIRAAVEAGATRLILGIGSSASTDGGVGMLRALGGRFLTADGAEASQGAGGLARIAQVDLSGVTALPETLVLSDVTNPLLGPRGAAAVFGPQKGLDRAGRELAEAGLARLAGLIGLDPEAPGSGAAGGVGYALRALGARVTPGAERLGDVLGLPELVASADVVITGEGAFDGQSLAGKVPGYVVSLASEQRGPSRRRSSLAAPQGPPALLLAAGRIAADADVSAFRATCSLVELAGSPEAAIAGAGRWLEEAGSRLALSYGDSDSAGPRG